MEKQDFIKISGSFFVAAQFKQPLETLGLKSIDSIFSFSGGQNLHKKELDKHRSRLQLELNNPSATLFLKRYQSPPLLSQIKNWLNNHSICSLALSEANTALKLSNLGINVPQVVCFGDEQGLLFEKRSFVITNKILNSESLEKKLPAYFYGPITDDKLNLRKSFIRKLADFIKKFHETGYRHRDLYLCHIFYDGFDKFHLIDLARAFRPMVFSERFRIKDLAQLYYSAPAAAFSKSDRIRFYLYYTAHKKLTAADKIIISKIKLRANRMALHNKKHGRIVPFEN